jgi:hypothetical protein
MTVATTATEHEFVSAGTLSPVAIPFVFGAPSQVLAFTVVAGVETPLTYGSAYSVSGNGRTLNGVYTPLTVVTAGVTVRLRRRTTRQQSYSSPVPAPAVAKSLETALDDVMMIAQEVDAAQADTAARAIQVPRGAVAPVADLADVQEGDLLQMRGGKLRRFRAEMLAGLFLAVGAGGAIVGAPGTGNDAGLRTALATGIGAEIALAGGVGLDKLDNSLRGGTFRTSMYPSIAVAVAAWVAAGGTLLIDSDHNVTAPIFSVLETGKTYRITSDKRRKLTYTGTATGDAMFRFYLAAGRTCPVEIEGSINWDANGLAAAPLMFLSDVLGGDRAPVTMRGKHTFRNGRSLVGSGYEAMGLCFAGGFDDIDIEGFEIRDIAAAVGATIGGSRGTRGLVIAGELGTTKGAATVRVGQHKIVNIQNLETVGGPQRVEMDGALIFQPSEGARSAPIVEKGYYENCLVRAIKIFAPFGGGAIRDIEDVLTLQPGTGGSVRLNQQHGSGTIMGYRGRYTAGAAGQTIIPIGQAVTGYALAARTVHISDVDIDDATGTTQPCLIDLRRNATSSVTPYEAVIDNVKSSGLYECLSLVGELGTYVDARVALRAVDCRLSIALLKTDSAQFYLKLTAEGLTNRSGTTVPGTALLSGTMRSTDWGDLAAIGRVDGIGRYVGAYRTVFGFTNGLRGIDGGVEAEPPYGKCEVVGRVAFKARPVANNANTTYPAMGRYDPTGGDHTFQVRVGTRFAYFMTAANSQTLTAIANNGIILTNGGTPAATPGTVEVVKDANMQIIVHNYSGVTDDVCAIGNA